eukprot:4953959-Prymnesium_polylepis.1
MVQIVIHVRSPDFGIGGVWFAELQDPLLIQFWRIGDDGVNECNFLLPKQLVHHGCKVDIRKELQVPRMLLTCRRLEVASGGVEHPLRGVRQVETKVHLICSQPRELRVSLRPLAHDKTRQRHRINSERCVGEGKWSLQVLLQAERDILSWVRCCRVATVQVLPVIPLFCPSAETK